jgi:predicted RNase H-like HicB family nuclease
MNKGLQQFLKGAKLFLEKGRRKLYNNRPEISEKMLMATIKFTIQMNCGVRHDEEADVFVSYCPRLDVYSQGDTENGAIEGIRSAIALHISTAFDYNRLDQVLRKAGFQRMSGEPSAADLLAQPVDEFVHVQVKQHDYKCVPIEVPLTLLAAQAFSEYARSH